MTPAPGAAQVLRAHGVARALGRDHEDVEVGPRLDQVEVDVEAVGEGQRRALAQVGGEVLAVQLALQLVGRQHHDHVGPGGGLGRALDREAGGLGLLDAARAGPERHRHLGNAAVLQVVGVGVALAAVADDGHLLALD
jgi:hypothetical protein